MRRFFQVVIVAFLMTVFVHVAAYAVQPDEILPDPVMEQRARTISKELRCLVCQNQSIDDSNADLARDLRILLRQRLKAGDSDEQARQYIVDRYGDYVLLKPPLKPETLLLWISPFLFLFIAIALALPFYRNKEHKKS